MKIAITDLKDYNEGILRFEWLDLEEYSTASTIGTYIKKFLDQRSKETHELHEEWFVTDYEEFVNLGEYPSFEVLEEAISLTKDFDWEAVSAYAGLTGGFLSDFEDAYCGTHDSEEEYAYALMQDCYDEDDLGPFAAYIDWKSYARDLFITDYTSETLSEGQGIVVFRIT